MSKKDKSNNKQENPKGQTSRGQENGNGKKEEMKEQEAQAQQQKEEEAEQSDKKENQEEKSGQDEWKTKHDELNDKYLRLFSEFDNFRKRTQREKSDLIKSASEDLIKEMLPLLDDMERALDNIGENQQEAREGMELIYNKFFKVLQQNGLEVMESKGQPFDTDYHEAISRMQAPDKDMKGKVMEEVEKGYFLNGKVIRFAKVVVGN